MNSTIASMMIIIAVLLALPQSANAADAAAGQAAYAVCAACHGQQGEGNVAMNAPKINGQEGWYIARQSSANPSQSRSRPFSALSRRTSRTTLDRQSTQVPNTSKSSARTFSMVTGPRPPGPRARLPSWPDSKIRHRGGAGKS